MDTGQLSSREILFNQYESLKSSLQSSKDQEKNQEILKSQNFPLIKPTSFLVLLNKCKKKFGISQKPLIFPYEQTVQVKSFQVFSKVYQILEFHEAKKIEKFGSGNVSESFSVNSSYFFEHLAGNPEVYQSLSPLPRGKRSAAGFEHFSNQEKLGNLYKSYLGPTIKGHRQAQLLDFKEKAKQKEIFMQKRKKSAIKIQSAFKGYKQRQKFKLMWKKHIEIQNIEKLRIISFRLKILFAPYIILNALKKWLKIRKAAKRRVSQFFYNFSATFIQKCWKGYKTRKKFTGVLLSKKRIRSKLKALVQGWKIRKIIKSAKISSLKKGIQDLQILKSELEMSPESSDLYMQIVNQMPIMREKLIREVHRLYATGCYLKTKNVGCYLKPQTNTKGESLIYSENSIQNLSPIRSREDEPVLPYNVKIQEPEAEKKPAKIFKNFLKRGQNCKYRPRPSPTKPRIFSPSKAEIIEQIPKIPKIPKIPLEFDDNNEEFEESEDFEDSENFEENEENEETNEKIEKKTYLKRKSKNLIPRKVEWVGRSRVDCWGESVGSVKKIASNKKTPQKKPAVKKVNKAKEGFEIVEKLEKVFAELCKSHLTAAQHFSKRLNDRSKIPQLLPGSKFIKYFVDEGYQETFENLQICYLNLCNEEDL